MLTFLHVSAHTGRGYILLTGHVRLVGTITYRDSKANVSALSFMFILIEVIDTLSLTNCLK